MERKRFTRSRLVVAGAAMTGLLLSFGAAFASAQDDGRQPEPPQFTARVIRAPSFAEAREASRSAEAPDLAGAHVAMAKEQFQRTKPHVNIGFVGGRTPDTADFDCGCVEPQRTIYESEDPGEIDEVKTWK
jgi:hypothetical protein